MIQPQPNKAPWPFCTHCGAETREPCARAECPMRKPVTAAQHGTVLGNGCSMRRAHLHGSDE